MEAAIEIEPNFIALRQGIELSDDEKSDNCEANLLHTFSLFVDELQQALKKAGYLDD